MSFNTTVGLDNQIWRSERACAANCAYLLLKMHGRECDYSDVEKRLVKENLSNAHDIKLVLQEHGLETTIFRTDMDRLSRADFPVIAHVEQSSALSETSGHFVLLIGFGDDMVEYYDGTTVERYRIRKSEFSKNWTGIAIVANAQRNWGSVWCVVVVGFFLGFALYYLRHKVIGRVRIVAAKLSAFIVLLLASNTPCTAQSIQEIAQSFERNYEKVSTLSMEATVVLDATELGNDVYFQDYGFLPGMVEKHHILYARDGRLFSRIVSPWLEIGNEVLSALDENEKANYSKALHIANEIWQTREMKSFGSMFCFDGNEFKRKSKLLQYTNENKDNFLIEIFDRKQIKTLIPRNPLDWHMYGFPMKSNADPSQGHAFLFGEGYGDPARIKVHGVDLISDMLCIKISIENSDVWICPKFGNMIMRRDMFYEGNLVFRVEMKSPLEISNGVWLAQNVTATTIAAKGMDKDERVGNPVCTKHYTIKKWSVNDRSHLDLLRVNTKAGDHVIDNTISLDKDSAEPVFYVHPADRKDLDSVIRKAQEASPTDPTFERSETPAVSALRRLAIVATILIVVFTVALWMRKRFR
ncbi:MAG: cysteine peptidase family C39 domain-containing protein [Pirellula sp.]|jgi:hypothetical protein